MKINSTMICGFLLKILKKLIVFVISFVVTISFPFVIILISPIYIFRYFVFKTSKFFRPDLGKMLSTRSCVSSIDDMYTKPNISLAVVMAIEGDIPLHLGKKRWTEAVLDKKGKDGNLLRPEMKQYLTSWMGFHFWKDDPNFNIDDHIFYHKDPEFGDKFINEEDLLKLSLKLLQKPYKRKRPLWDINVVQNYRPNRGPEGLEQDKTRIVLILRIHHCLADGFSIVQMLLEAGENVGIKMPIPSYETPSNWKKFKDVFTFCVKVPFLFMPEVLNSWDFNAWRRPKMKKGINAAAIERIEMDRLKNIKSFFGVSVTTVVIAAVTGAIRSHMIRTGVKVPKRIHTGTTLPVSNHPSEKLRNHMTMCTLALPVGESDPVIRLKIINDEIQRARTSVLPQLFFFFLPILGGLFHWMARILIRNSLMTCLLTSFPGPKETLRFMGVKVTDLALGSGLLPGSTAVGFTTLSYNGNMNIIGGGDTALILTEEEARVFINGITDEIHVLEKIANV